MVLNKKFSFQVYAELDGSLNMVIMELALNIEVKESNLDVLNYDYHAS